MNDKKNADGMPMPMPMPMADMMPDAMPEMMPDGMPMPMPMDGMQTMDMNEMEKIAGGKGTMPMPMATPMMPKKNA